MIKSFVKNTEADIWSALNSIPADDRDTWLKVGMAIKSELGDAGFSLWDEWSQTASNYSENAAREVWRSFKDGNINIATLFHLAKESGWNFKSKVQAPLPNPKPAPAPQKRNMGIYGQELWIKGDWRTVGSHPNAMAKGIDWAAGAARGIASGRVIGQNADCIIVPARDLHTNRVAAVQCINPEGVKQTFGPISGHGFICGNTLNKSIRWFVVEGWADAVSMVFHHYAGNAVAFAAFGKGSMDKLAEKVVEVYAPDQLVILEDAA